ncbi:hypothetical protein AAG906_041038 [Vitis piasezkii]
MGWDGYDDLPVATLPVEFRMPDIERYTRIGCPRIHLQLYSTDDHAIPSISEQCRSTLVCLIRPFEEKKSGLGSRPSDVATIGMTGHRPTGPTYLHPALQPVYATQAPQRPLVLFHQQYRAASTEAGWAVYTAMDVFEPSILEIG